jgi:uncharacterized membrane protein
MSVATHADRGAVSALDAAPDGPARAQRLQSIDILRGAVMVLMAIDHVRVYAGVPAGGPDYGVFFTRWVTHFCAPLFVFLAGTSAWFYRERHGAAAVSRFLATRGVWLIVLELTVLRLAWTFNLDFEHYMLAGVIWVIGWSMVFLSLAARLPVAVVAVIGAGIIAGHNAMGAALGPSAESLLTGPMGWWWSIAYFGGPVPVGGEPSRLVVLYSLIPWIGVIAAGFAFGAVLQRPDDRRHSLCLLIGIGCMIVFVLLRWTEWYGDWPWRQQLQRMPALLAFLNTSKYPASLLFLLMTLGPAIALIPWLEALRGRVAGWLAMLGRVPLFYYVLHIPLIHLSALAVAAMRSPDALPWLFENHPMGNGRAPEGYRWSLGLLYLVTAVDVLLLTLACRWYVQRRHRHPLLSYL